MFGTLREIEITEDLIMKVARDEFSRLCNGDVLDDQREYIRVGWVNSACGMLEDFNDLAVIFKKLKIECGFDNFGCGHDVEEFYME